jgi:hypothetical protein
LGSLIASEFPSLDDYQRNLWTGYHRLRPPVRFSMEQSSDAGVGQAPAPAALSYRSSRLLSKTEIQRSRVVVSQVIVER